MAQTLIFDAYNAYLTLVQTACPTWTVFDGPQPVLPTDKQMILLGVDDPLTGGMQLAVDAGQQDWESLGAGARMETFTILSTLVVWTGDNDLPGCRASAKTALTAIAAALRPAPGGTGDAMLGNVLNLGGTGWCGIGVTRMSQIQEGAGVALHVQFALACTARL